MFAPSFNINKTVIIMKYFPILVVISLTIFSCGGGSSQETNSGGVSPKSMVNDETVTSSDPMDNKGIGPVSDLELGPLDEGLAAEGKAIYEELCMACHKPTEKFIGPAPAGIMDRRSPEWVMNMILNPDQMVREDPIAKLLLVEYNMAPMANQGLTEEQARKIVEYFRTLK
jgi:cytochrome c